MRVKGKRILKNGAVAGYVYYSDEKKWKWRIIKGPKKGMKGGKILTAQDILDNFYLCTQTRYDKPIIDELLPMGSFEELNGKYSSHHIALKKIKNKAKTINNAKILGSSQYGLYFRFVRKNHLDDDYGFYKNNTNYFNYENNINRTFVFDIEKLLEYIKKFQTTIPLCWFAGHNAYGYENYWDTFLFKNFIEAFLSNIGSILEERLYDHEFVCRIPIPINNDEAGFLGVSPISILDLYNNYNNNYNNYNNYNNNYNNYNNNYIFDMTLAKKQLIRKKNKNNYKNKKRICINQGCKIKSRGKGKFICNCNHLSTNV
jgi:hypothetical protein